MEQEMMMLSPEVSGRRSPFLHQYLRQYSSTDYSTFSPRTPLTPSSASFDEDNEEVDNRLYLAGLSLQRQDFISRYELCLSHLQKAVRESRALRLENAQLLVANAELTQRLKDLSSPRRRPDGRASTASLEKEMRRLSIGDPVASSPPAEASPTSVLQMVKVNALPKSISVRSTGYKKMISPEGEPNRSSRIRVSTPVAIRSQQRVFVGASSSSSGSGGKKEKEKDKKKELEEPAGLVGLELDVYNQGMFKTELCNKWQESGGNCPYGENCQFAHGISELRPVIRHPRYKTEVCRMVLAGDPCPYGHRCHFRHALSPHQSNLHL